LLEYFQFDRSQWLRCKLTRFDFDESPVIEKMTKILDDFGTCFEDLASRVVYHEVEVTLSVSLLSVFEAVVLRRKLVKARSEKRNFSCKHAELTHIARLGIRSAGETNNTNPIGVSSGHVLAL